MINYFLTEVKGANIGYLEKAGDFCLKPAQYLFHGKKVDFIQGKKVNFIDENCIAAQKDLIFNPHERTWLKVALMVLLFIPGTILGFALKIYPFCSREKAHDALIKKTLNSGREEQICSEDAEFKSIIENYIALLKNSSSSSGSGYQPAYFLSEVKKLDLGYEHTQRNVELLYREPLLWNLPKFGGTHVVYGLQLAESASKSAAMLETYRKKRSVGDEEEL